MNKQRTVATSLHHPPSFAMVGALGGRLVGLINAITDRVFYAYIPLLEVLPPYQKQGIGEELMRRMKALLASFYAIDLCCDSTLSGYYQKQGFREVSGMILRNYAHQTGPAAQEFSSRNAKSSQGLAADS